MCQRIRTSGPEPNVFTVILRQTTSCYTCMRTEAKHRAESFFAQGPNCVSLWSLRGNFDGTQTALLATFFQHTSGCWSQRCQIIQFPYKLSKNPYTSWKGVWIFFLAAHTLASDLYKTKSQSWKPMETKGASLWPLWSIRNDQATYYLLSSASAGPDVFFLLLGAQLKQPPNPTYARVCLWWSLFLVPVCLVRILAPRWIRIGRKAGVSESFREYRTLYLSSSKQ